MSDNPLPTDSLYGDPAILQGLLSHAAPSQSQYPDPTQPDDSQIAPDPTAQGPPALPAPSAHLTPHAASDPPAPLVQPSNAQAPLINLNGTPPKQRMRKACDVCSKRKVKVCIC